MAFPDGLEMGTSWALTGTSINFQDAAERYPQVDFRLRHFARQNQRHNTAIKFHEPSSKMLIAWEGITGIGIKHFTPRTRDPSEQGPTWVIEGGMFMTPLALAAYRPVPSVTLLTNYHTQTGKGYEPRSQSSVTVPPPPSTHCSQHRQARD